MAAAQAHLQQRAALEESALPIMLDTMVRAVRCSAKTLCRLVRPH